MNTTTFLLGGCVKHRGLPIASVELTLMRAANRFAGTQATALAAMLTPGTGEYRFTVEAGEYFLQVRPDHATRFVSFQTESIFVNGNTKLDVLLELGRVWTGRFVSASAQSNDYDYELRLQSDQGVGPALVKPLRLGENFELVLEKASYNAVVVRHSDDGALTIWSQNLSAQNDIRLDIVLPDLFKLAGTVLDEQGTPLNQARVTVLRTEYLKRVTTSMPEVESVLMTGSNGRFEGVLPEGYYVAMVEAPGMAAHPVPIKLHTDTDINIPMSAGLNANGQVLLKGVPVTSLKLLITGVNRQFMLPTQVDDEGKFDVWVPSGSYEFRIGGLEHTWMPPAGVPQKKIVSEQLEFEATADSAVVADRTDAGTKDNLSPAASLEANDEKISNAGTQSGSELSKGISTSMGAQANTGSMQKLTRVLAPWVRLIDVGNNLDGNIKLQDGYIVEFEVVDQNDHAITNCVVDCQLYEAERDSDIQPHSPEPEQRAAAPYGIIGRALTDSTGRCRLILGAGIYTFDFIPDESSQAQYKQIRQLSINGNLRRKVRLADAGTAEIISMDSASKTAAGIVAE